VDDNDEMIGAPAARRGAAIDPGRGPASLLLDHQVDARRIRLFDPNRLLAAIAVLFWPLKFLYVLSFPAAAVAALTVFKHWNEITADLQQFFGEFSFVVRLLLGFLVVNLSVRLAMGAVLRGCGVAVREFGVILFLGIIPRFYIDRSAMAQLDRNGQLWAYAAPLLVRLGYFAFGTLLWAAYRSSGSWIASFGLVVSQAGFWSLLFAAVPLVPADGYYYLVTYFRQPALRERALLTLYAKATGRPLPAIIRRKDVPMLVLFGIGCIAAIALLALGLLVLLSVALTAALHGLGAVLALALAASFMVWLARVRSRVVRGQRRPQESALLQTVMASQMVPPPRRRAGRRRGRAALWAAAGAALILVGLLPYSYEPAGPFEILPGGRGAATASTSGEVVSIAAHEGEWVRAGQVVAQLGSWDEQRDVDIARAQLDRATKRLAALQAGQADAAAAAQRTAPDGELAFARDEVERLKRQLARSEDGLERTRIRAPMEGRVTTPDVQLKTGSWLNAGDALLQIADTRRLEAQVEIPQGDVDLIRPGDRVRLRAWAEDGGEFVGRVARIAPTVEEKADESVVRIEASIVKADGVLRPGMHGFAKLAGRDMHVWSALARLCIRFFTVELWSWIP
jgi:RND family efflux transporter MFP subunit